MRRVGTGHTPHMLLCGTLNSTDTAVPPRIIAWIMVVSWETLPLAFGLPQDAHFFIIVGLAGRPFGYASVQFTEILVRYGASARVAAVWPGGFGRAPRSGRARQSAEGPGEFR